MIARTSPARNLLWALALAGAVFVAGCATPFGPGYLIESQSVDVTYPSNSPASAQVRASYRLRNTGSGPFDRFEVELPNPKIFAIRDPEIQWSGARVQQVAFGETGIRFHVPLGAKWQVGTRDNLQISYTIQVAPEASASSAAAGNPFVLFGSGWYPRLQPPGGTFATGGGPPMEWILNLHLPPDFAVHASGRQISRSRKNGPLDLRFRQSIHGYGPYVAAAAFVQQDVKAGPLTVSFWSQAPVPTDRARDIAQRIAASDAFFVKQFGPRIANLHAVWVIECPASEGSFSSLPWTADRGCMTLPESVIVPPGFLENSQSAEGSQQQQIMQSIEAQLAATWLSFLMRPDPATPPFPIAAAPDYAQFAFEASLAPGSRTDMVRALLDQVPAPAAAPPQGKKEKSLSSVTLGDPPEVRDAARIKSELFLIALEDRCGVPNFRGSIAHLLKVLRYDTWGASDLRSALEARCNADLGPLFREWLDKPGIRQDFRARYSGAAIKSDSEEKQ